MEVSLNTSPPIYTEVLDNGDLLIVGDKPRIEHKNGNVTGFCLDLRHYYSKSSGLIKRNVRSDQEVIKLSQEWLNRITEEE